METGRSVGALAHPASEGVVFDEQMAIGRECYLGLRGFVGIVAACDGQAAAPKDLRNA